MWKHYNNLCGVNHAPRSIVSKVHTLCGIRSDRLYYRKTLDGPQLQTDGREGSHTTTFFGQLLLAGCLEKAKVLNFFLH